MKTLIYHFGGLGDFLTILPATAVWKELYETSVTLLGKPSFGALAKAAGYIDDIIDAESGLNSFLFQEDPDHQRLSTFFASFDTIILFAVPDSPLIDHARNYSSAKILHQPPFPDSPMHIVDYHLSIIEDAQPAMEQRIPILSLPDTRNNNMLNLLRQKERPVIAMHPGSGSSRKNWPFENYLTIAKQLRDENYEILWICGPAEGNIDIPKEDTLIKDMPLTELAVILNHCNVFAGNDSGITHLAAAAGCPVIAIFGPSDPAVWGPRGKNIVKILYHPLECSPCHQRNNKLKTCNQECLKDVQPEEVFTALKQVMYGRTSTAD